MNQQNNSTYDGPEYPVYIGEIPIDLSKRLANSADSLRDGKYHFIVAELFFPFRCRCTRGYEDPRLASREADGILNSLPEAQRNRCGKFGPYISQEVMGYMMEGYEVTTLLTVKNTNKNEIRTLEIKNEEGVDAIVYNLAAYDKFFFPYYSRIYGPESALEMRNEAQKIFLDESYEKNELNIRAVLHKHCTSVTFAPFGALIPDNAEKSQL